MNKQFKAEISLKDQMTVESVNRKIKHLIHINEIFGLKLVSTNCDFGRKKATVTFEPVSTWEWESGIISDVNSDYEFYSVNKNLYLFCRETNGTSLEVEIHGTNNSDRMFVHVFEYLFGDKYIELIDENECHRRVYQFVIK